MSENPINQRLLVRKTVRKEARLLAKTFSYL